MKIPSEKELDRIRREYPVGTIIEIQGSSLKVILSEDRVRKVAGAITICYGRRELWRSRKEAADFFLEGMASTEGSECERYATIYTKLILGYKVCSDED